MTKEYIERETVVTFLENMAASRYLIQCFENKEKFPAADVEPVQHGEWVYDRTYYEADECHCSLCNQLMTTARGIRMKYCPNCGAKIDGGK